MFGRVCRFQVRVWESYRNCRSFGYGYGSVTELTEVPGIVARAYITHRFSGQVQKNVVPVPRVLWHGAYRTHRSSSGYERQQTHRSSRYGYESLTELTEVPGIVARAYRTHNKFRAGINTLYPYPGYCGHGRTELTEVPGTGMNVVQNLQKFWVRV